VYTDGLGIRGPDFVVRWKTGPQPLHERRSCS
jgi:hypothetical protein